MTRTRLILIVIAVGLAVAIAAGAFRRNIDAEQATAMAEKMLAQYRTASGQPAVHFTAREGLQWADGWEFRWRYRPCPERASLRIWISRDGRRASFAEVPDCSPDTGLATPAEV